MSILRVVQHREPLSIKRRREGCSLDSGLWAVHAALVPQLRALVVKKPAVVVARAPGTARVDGLVDVFAYARGPAEVERRIVDINELAGRHLDAVQSHDSVRVELENV